MIIVVVVESKTKAVLLQKTLGSKFFVIECNGHIADMPVDKLGYDEESFEIFYVLTKTGNVFLKRLKTHIQNENVEKIFLCTDPDREGEIISFQIQKYVSVFFSGPFERLVLKEMSGKALLEAMKHGTNINLMLVESQQARRVLDRMIGYKISSLLYKRIYFPVSVGRVQTPALALICKKFIEHLLFISKIFFNLIAVSQHQTAEVHFENNKTFNNMNDIPILDIEQFVLSTTTESITITKAPLPLDTVSLQRRANSCFGFSAKKTMSIAQQLFEGKIINGDSVGFVTYIRTDSKRMSKDFFNSVSVFLKQNYNFVNINQPEIYKEEEKYIQDAHECIRPIDLSLSPNRAQEYLDEDESKLYTLIYYIAICSCMSDAKIKNIKSNFESTSVKARFSFNKQSIKEKGFLTIKEIEKLVSFRLDTFEQNITFEKKKHTEKGPRLLSEITLITQLNELGIGRPSTYATICPLLFYRKYLKNATSSLEPTSLGRFILAEMQYFSYFFDLTFTAQMEKQLNEICLGNMTSTTFLQSCSNRIQSYALEYSKRLKSISSSVVLNKCCCICGENCTIKLGRFGPYAFCNNNHKFSLEEEVLNFFFFHNVSGMSIKALMPKKIFKTTFLDDQNHHMFFDGKVLFCKLCRIKQHDNKDFLIHL